MVREQSAKLRCSGSNPLGASKPHFVRTRDSSGEASLLLTPRDNHRQCPLSNAALRVGFADSEENIKKDSTHRRAIPTEDALERYERYDWDKAVRGRHAHRFPKGAHACAGQLAVY